MLRPAVSRLRPLRKRAEAEERAPSGRTGEPTPVRGGHVRGWLHTTTAPRCGGRGAVVDGDRLLSTPVHRRCRGWFSCDSLRCDGQADAALLQKAATLAFRSSAPDPVFDPVPKSELQTCALLGALGTDPLRDFHTDAIAREERRSWVVGARSALHPLDRLHTLASCWMTPMNTHRGKGNRKHVIRRSRHAGGSTTIRV